jgi:hypothetical protein
MTENWQKIKYNGRNCCFKQLGNPFLIVVRTNKIDGYGGYDIVNELDWFI